MGKQDGVADDFAVEIDIGLGHDRDAGKLLGKRGHGEKQSGPPVSGKNRLVE